MWKLQTSLNIVLIITINRAIKTKLQNHYKSEGNHKFQPFILKSNLFNYWFLKDFLPSFP